MTENTADERNAFNPKKKAPVDFKPDIRKITANRISSITKQFIEKTNMPITRPAWKKKLSADLFPEEEEEYSPPKPQ